VIRSSEQKIVFFGCPLDCDEKHDAIEEKLSGNWSRSDTDDPLEAVTHLLMRRGLAREQYISLGSIDVPGWLRPFPLDRDRSRILAEAFVDFIDQNGCRRYADNVERFVRSKILPDFPCMVAVDHSMTGGVFKALAAHYGRENISLVVVDSHTDAVPMSGLAGAIQYDIDNNPNSFYDRSDPLIYGRTESYNASSFLQQMLEEGQLAPRDLYILGISDYPEKRSMRIKDPRIADYVGAYTGLKRKGTTLITKKECQQKPTKVKNLLNKIRTPYVYLSIDMDIGARNALEGVRFKNWRGLQERQIDRLIDAVMEARGTDVHLVGMDITEINPRSAGRFTDDVEDRTYHIAVNMIEKIAFGREGQEPRPK